MENTSMEYDTYKPVMLHDVKVQAMKKLVNEIRDIEDYIK